MRKLLLALFIPSLLSATAQLNVGLKAHWTFGAGSTIDVSGNGHDGTVLGNVTTTIDREGGFGCAMLFPGDTSAISVPFSGDFDISPIGAFTISLWYQGGSVAPGDLEWLFAKRTASNGNYSNDYAVCLYDLNRVLGSLGDNGLWSPVEPAVPDTQWHHVAYLYNNGVQQIWQDNILQSWDSTQQVLVGQSGQNIIIGEKFQGAIDDIRFYDRDLSTAEIGLLFQESASCSSMGIAESMASTITIAPNPTTGAVTVDFGAFTPGSVHQLELFDAIGRSVKRYSVRGTATTLHLDDLPNGLYLITVLDGGQSLQHRIVKQ